MLQIFKNLKNISKIKAKVLINAKRCTTRGILSFFVYIIYILYISILGEGGVDGHFALKFSIENDFFMLIKNVTSRHTFFTVALKNVTSRHTFLISSCLVMRIIAEKPLFVKCFVTLVQNLFKKLQEKVDKRGRMCYNSDIEKNGRISVKTQDIEKAFC